jgi:hypothetical protein
MTAPTPSETLTREFMADSAVNGGIIPPNRLSRYKCFPEYFNAETARGFYQHLMSRDISNFDPTPRTDWQKAIVAKVEPIYAAALAKRRRKRSKRNRNATVAELKRNAGVAS